jgi:hypothetical protein
MTRDEMFSRLSSSEYHDWMLLEQVEPFGDRRFDLHFALLSSLIANFLSHSNDYKPEDFLIDFDAETKPEQSAEQQAAMLEAIFGPSNG